jgi:WD40 repeat protein
MGEGEGNIDVFLSFSSADRALARHIGERLQAHGFSTFVDEKDLRAGLPWIEALEAAIGSARAVAVLIGGGAFGNVQQYEKGMAFVRRARDPQFLLVPVLLPGCETPPTGFLELETWVDLRASIDAPEGWTKLLAALRGEAADSDPVRDSVCPYMGLEPFREEDAQLYCGREQVVSDLVEQVQARRLVAVVGRSGSGKSSLVFAGLLPELRRERPAVWDVVSLRPGAFPLHSLAEALGARGGPSAPVASESVKGGAKPAGASDEDSVLLDQALDAQARHLREDDDALLRIMLRRRERARENPSKLLLYVDQWEELYTLEPAENEGRRRRHAADVERFIALLFALSRDSQSGTTVVLTVRADFYGVLMAHPVIGKLLPSHQVNLGPLKREEMCAAIVTPARKCGLSFEPPSLVEEILTDAGSDEAVLPLLQYALKETWMRRSKRALTAAGYAECGGVNGAIQQTASRIYDKLTAEEKRLTRSLFLGLVTPGEGSEDTRARIAMPSDPALRRIIEKFANRNARLLVAGSEAPVARAAGGAAAPRSPGPPGPPLQGAAASSDSVPPPIRLATLEVAHEALIRNWREFRTWVDANRERLLLRKAIVQLQQEWQVNGRRPDLLLAPGFQLARAAALVADPGDIPVDDLREYVKLSQRAESSRRRWRLVAGVGAVALALAAVTSILFVRASHREAEQLQADSAEEKGRALLLQGDPLRAIPNLTAARLEGRDDGSLRTLFAQAVRSAPAAMLRGDFAQAASNTLLTFSGTTAEVRRVAADGAVTVLRSLKHPPLIHAAALNADGDAAATAGDDGRVRIWNLTANRNPVVIAEAARIVAFCPDGKQLATASADGVVRLWGLDGTMRRELRAFDGLSPENVRAVVFGEGGRLLSTLTDAGTVRVFDASTGEIVLERVHEGARVLAFAPDGKHLLVGSEKGVAQLWAVGPKSDSGALVQDAGEWLDGGGGQGAPIALSDGKVAAHRKEITTASFSPDGQHLVTASADGTARVWAARSGKPESVPLQQPPEIRSAAFSPDGEWVVTAGLDKTVRIWNWRTGDMLWTSMKHGGALRYAFFLRNPSCVITVGGDRLVRVWLLPDRFFVPLPHDDVVTAARFSADGKLVATASREQARLWDARTGRLIFQLGPSGAPRTDAGRSDNVRALAFRPDGAELMTCSGERASLWDTATGALVREIDAGAGIRMATFSPDGKRLATAHTDGSAQIWDAASGERWGPRLVHRGTVTTVAFSRDGARVVTASLDRTARVWSTATGALVEGPFTHDGPVESAEISADGRRMVTASEDATARVWFLGTSKPPVELPHGADVRAAHFSPDGRRVVTASYDNTARIWDAETGQPLTQPLLHDDHVESAEFSPNGEWVVTASGDHTARIWDAQTGNPLAPPLSHRDAVLGASFSPDGVRVVSASVDHTARIWEIPMDSSPAKTWQSIAGASQLQLDGRGTGDEPDESDSPICVQLANNWYKCQECRNQACNCVQSKWNCDGARLARTRCIDDRIEVEACPQGCVVVPGSWYGTDDYCN